MEFKCDIKSTKKNVLKVINLADTRKLLCLNPSPVSLSLAGALKPGKLFFFGGVASPVFFKDEVFAFPAAKLNAEKLFLLAFPALARGRLLSFVAASLVAVKLITLGDVSFPTLVVSKLFLSPTAAEKLFLLGDLASPVLVTDKLFLFPTIAEKLFLFTGVAEKLFLLAVSPSVVLAADKLLFVAAARFPNDTLVASFLNICI